MSGAGTGSNMAGRIIRNDIADILDPFSSVLDRNKFIGHRIAPFYRVGKAAGEFPKRLLKSYLKRVDTKRMEDGTANRIYVSIGGDQYSVRPYVIEAPVDNWQEESYRDQWNMTLDLTDQMRDVMAREFEITTADHVRDKGNYSETWQKIAAAVPWNDPDADILKDIEMLKRQRDTKMLPANALICTDRVYRQFAMNNGILARISSGGAGVAEMPSNVTKARLADLFGVDEIIVGGGVYDDSNETSADHDNDQGFEDLNLKRIWSDQEVYLGIVLPPGQRPSFTRPSFGYTMQWSRWPRGERIDMYYEQQRDGYVLRNRTNYDLKVFGNRTYSKVTGTWAD